MRVINKGKTERKRKKKKKERKKERKKKKERKRTGTKFLIWDFLKLLATRGSSHLLGEPPSLHLPLDVTL